MFSVILVVVIVLLYVSFLIPPTYSEDVFVQSVGIMPKSTCNIIGGKLVTTSIDSDQFKTTELCQYNDEYYRPYVPETCYDQIGLWKDPKIGKEYTFSSTCEVPVLCNAGGTAGLYDDSYGYKDSSHITLVVVDDKKFDVTVDSKGQILCNALKFIQEQKKIEIFSRGERSANSITVTIPTQLLSGDFDVLVDGKSENAQIQKTDNASIITVDLDFSLSEDDLTYGYDKVEIIGILAVPEFPDTVPNSIPSPRQQIAHGILPENVECSYNFVLIQKISKNTVACVKPDTSLDLTERGWKRIEKEVVFLMEKTEYKIGEKITITMMNTGQKAIFASSTPIGFTIVDEKGHLVCTWQGTSEAIGYFQPNGTMIRVWNQGYCPYRGDILESGQVPAGTYMVGFKNANPMPFRISD